MANVYDILARVPAQEERYMHPRLEEMAKRLVSSGRFRVEADDRRNFIRFSLPAEGINTIFSKRELFDPLLAEKTKNSIKNFLGYRQKSKELEQKTDREIERLKREIGKYPEVNEDIELKLARIIVQSTHPAVMMLLLAEGTEVFVSYSHNIGELLDIQSWQTVGGNSGMQSTDGRQAAIFVSSGGDPFLYGDKRVYTTDGFPAMARMTIIAAQELGHYADIIRDKKGRQIYRHSSDIYGRKPKEKARKARRSDIKTVKAIEKQMAELGLNELIELERHAEFYKKFRPHSLTLLAYKLNTWLFKKKFQQNCINAGLNFIAEFPHRKLLGTNLGKFIADMKDNLSPKADVYKSDDKDEEEATACAEALARVPQQTKKWGHLATKAAMTKLYKIYYADVIPGCIKAYEAISGQKYEPLVIDK